MPFLISVLAIIGGLAIGGLITSCSKNANIDCKEFVETKTRWIERRVETKADAISEIDATIRDNQCDGISPQLLNKVLKDVLNAR